MRLPMAYNNDSEGPSVTLLFVWISGMLTAGSILALNFTEKTLMASVVGICFWALAVVFYRMRSLDKFKIDLDDRLIELEGSSGAKKNSSK